MTAAELTLEDRVSALEIEFAAMKQREFPDLRAETRGWAAFAVSADHKAAAATELLMLLHQDVKEVKDQLRGHGQVLDRHGQVLDEHTAKLDNHTEMLREILARLPKRV